MPKSKRKKSTVAKLVVLPVAIHAAEQQMAEFLRHEQWEETIELLEWMLSLPDMLPAKREEWAGLMEALQDLVPSQARARTEIEDEALLYSRLMRDKSRYDPQSVTRCLQVLHTHPSHEQQSIALDQLMYMEHPSIDRELIRWLADHVRPKRLQFRALHALKVRGWQGEVVVPGEQISQMIDPITIPLRMEEWPRPIRLIGTALSDRMLLTYPSFYSLIQTFWEEWLQRIYLDPIYEQLIELSEGSQMEWMEAFFREGIYAWLGMNPENEWTTDRQINESNVTEIRQLLRPYFQPYKS